MTAVVSPDRHCRACHKPVPVGPLIQGLGEKCARKRGLRPARVVRVRRPVRTGWGGEPVLDGLEELMENESNESEES